MKNEHRGFTKVATALARRAGVRGALGLALAAFAAALPQTGRAAPTSVYWDSNGPLAGAGSATPAGTWGTDPFWSPSSAGTAATAAWLSGDLAIFSAGTDASGLFTVTLNGTQTAGGVTFEDGTVTLSSGTLSLNAGAVVTVNAGRSATISSVIAGSTWTKQGGGSLTLSGVNTFAGPLTVTGGTVLFDNNSAGGVGSIAVSPSADVFLQSSIAATTLGNAFTFNAGNNLDVSALSGTLTLNGAIGGARTLWTVGGQAANTVVLGGNSSFSGNLKVLGGTLIITANNALGAAGPGGTTEVTPGATLGVQGGFAYTTGEIVKLNGTGVGSAGAMRNVSGNNTFDGEIDLLSSTTVGATAGSLELAGTIAGATFDLTKVGTGRVILSGLGNLFNNTIVSGGTLRVDTSLGSGSVSVAAGATLAGAGDVPGSVALSGIISPGASPDAITTGAEVWNSGAAYKWEINDADFGTAGGGPGWDLVDITHGAQTLGLGSIPINGFTIDITSVDPSFNLPGFPAGDFENTSDYDFLIASAPGGITGFAANKFVLQTSNFINPVTPDGLFVIQTENADTELHLLFRHKPTVTIAPLAPTQQCGSSVTFTATVTGSPTLSYQWFHGIIPVGLNSPTLTINPVSFADAGLYHVVVTNPYGSATSADATLTVIDTIPPVLTPCPANILVTDVGAPGEIVTFACPTATDSCDGPVPVTCSPPSGSLFPPGTTTVNVSATDSHGNPSTCSFSVTVCAPNQPVTYVDDNYVGKPNGTVVKFPDGGIGPDHVIGCDAFATIAGGVSAVAVAGTVNVAAGNYPENVNVNKAVLLLGANADVDPRVNCRLGPARGPESIIDGGLADAALALNASGITVNGFTIKRGSGTLNSGIWMYAGVQQDEILNNIITDNTIGVGAACSGTCSIRTNLITANNQPGPSSGAGIDAYATDSNLTVSDNEFTEHTIGNPILLEAVIPTSHTNIVIGRNNFHGNANASAIYSLGIIGGAIANNQIDSPAVTGIRLASANQNLSISNNLFVAASVGVRLVDDGYGLPANSDIRIHANSFGAMSSFAVAREGANNDSDAILDASANWWGVNTTALVPTKIDTSGTPGAVDFTPWLDSGVEPVAQVCDGFQGDFSVLHVWAGSPQVGLVGRIQEGIDLVSGSKVIIEAGFYVENDRAYKDNLELAGVGQASVTIVPTNSNPNCGGGSLCGGAASSIILVQANNVTIHDVTLDGNNPGITSGVLSGGVDVDARNGIIEDFNFGPGIFNNTTVYNTTVKNIYLRGIYASSGGTGFNFHNNTVQNVAGDPSGSVAIFNFGGSGAIISNTVSASLDAIAANWSTGTTFRSNVVTSSGSGVHSDNNGGLGGVADVLDGNVVSAMSPGAVGVMVFAPYVSTSVSNNIVSDCLYGLVCAGQQAVVLPTFINNTVDGMFASSYGAYETTSLFGFGSAPVAALWQGNNIQDNARGIYLEAEPGFGLEATISAANRVKNNNFGIYASGAQAKVKIENTLLTPNTTSGIQVTNGAIVDAGDCGGSNVTGLGSSAGGNNLSGYSFDNLPSFAIEDLNTTGQPDVWAFNNNYGAQIDIQNVIFDRADNASLTSVRYSQQGALFLSCPGPVGVQCAASVPAAATTLAGFLAQGGAASTTAASSVTSSDTSIHTTPNDQVITRHYTVTDSCGNVASCDQTITVDDTVPPVASTPPDRTLIANGICQVAIPDLTVEVVATDNCGPLHYSQVPVAGTLVGPGDYTVTVTTSDEGGNFVSHDTHIHVNPSAVQPAATFVDDDYTGLPGGTVVLWPAGTGTGPHYIGCDAFATITNGLARVAAGGMVKVAPGTYIENIVVDKHVDLLGARVGIDARGRVSGVPNPAVESIVIPAIPATRTLELRTGCALGIIDGFVFSGGTRAIESTTGPLDNVKILNNHIAGFTGNALFLNDNAIDMTIAQNVMDGASETSGDVLHLDTDVFQGLHIELNWIKNGITGLFCDGNRNFKPSVNRAPTITQNLVANNGTGVNLGSRSFDSGEISFNTFTNNAFDGLQGGPQASLIVSNLFVDNKRWGLALTAFTVPIAPGVGASNDTITCNTFLRNGIGGPGTGNGGIVFSANQFAGNNGSHHVNYNNFIGNTTGAVYTATETVDMTNNWWNAASGPTIASNPGGTGDKIQGATIVYSPFLTADTSFPVIVCPANIVTGNAPGQCTKVVNYVVTATSGCCGGSLATGTTPPSGFAFPVGVTTVTSSATNACGKISTCSFTVTVIDTEPPVIGPVTATETQPVVGNVIVKNCATVTVQGTVNISVVASDQCPLVPPTINLTNGLNTAVATFVNQSPPGTYNYTWAVTPATAGGTWTATVRASDNNNSTTSTFTLCVNAAQITGLVQLEGFVGTGTAPLHTRTVVFVATDTAPPGGGTVLKTWTIALSNVSGDTFAYTLTDVPLGTHGLSTKTAWNLRSKLPVTLDINGQASGVNFTGIDKLPGGDLQGDNLVNFFDYSILGNNFFTFNAVADITGDGVVNLDDYFVLTGNWFTNGDAQ